VALGRAHGGVEVWDPRTGSLTPAGHHTGSAPVLALAFSPNGRLVASGGRDSTARIWDTALQRQTVPALRDEGPVNGVAFDAGGRSLATASDDGTVRVWSVRNGGLEAVIATGAGAARSVIYAGGDGLFVTTALGRVAMYPCELCAIANSDIQLLRLARRRITRPMTCQEREAFLHTPCDKAKDRTRPG